MEKRLLDGLVIVVSNKDGKHEIFQIIGVSVRADCGSLRKWENGVWSEENYTMVYRGDTYLLEEKGTSSEVHVHVFSKNDQESLHLPPSFYVFPARPINPCLVIERMNTHLREINIELHKVIEPYPALQQQLSHYEQKKVQEFCSYFGGNLDLIKQQICFLKNLSAIQEKETQGEKTNV